MAQNETWAPMCGNIGLTAKYPTEEECDTPENDQGKNNYTAKVKEGPPISQEDAAVEEYYANFDSAQT